MTEPRMTSDERWEHIRLGLGFILLTPDTMTEHQIAVEAYEGLKARYERFAVALEAIRGPEDGGPFLGAYRTAGGGYEGLQAIAQEALK